MGFICSLLVGLHMKMGEATNILVAGAVEGACMSSSTPEVSVWFLD